MKDSLPRYTLRISKTMLRKLGYIADFEGRTKNKELEQIIKRHINEFEEKYGPITLDDLNQQK